jgi:hypothetical protein
MAVTIHPVLLQNSSRIVDNMGHGYTTNPLNVTESNNIRVHNRTRYLIFRHGDINVLSGSSITINNNRISVFSVWHPIFQQRISFHITVTSDSVRWICDSLSLSFSVIDDGIIVEDTIRLPVRLMI